MARFSVRKLHFGRRAAGIREAKETLALLPGPGESLHALYTARGRLTPGPRTGRHRRPGRVEWGVGGPRLFRRHKFTGAGTSGHQRKGADGPGGPKLTRKQEQAVAALLASPTVEAAAQR